MKPNKKNSQRNCSSNSHSRTVVGSSGRRFIGSRETTSTDRRMPQRLRCTKRILRHKWSPRGTQRVWGHKRRSPDSGSRRRRKRIIRALKNAFFLLRPRKLHGSRQPSAWKFAALFCGPRPERFQIRSGNSFLFFYLLAIPFRICWSHHSAFKFRSPVSNLRQYSHRRRNIRVGSACSLLRRLRVLSCLAVFRFSEEVNIAANNLNFDDSKKRWPQKSLTQNWRDWKRFWKNRKKSRIFLRMCKKPLLGARCLCRPHFFKNLEKELFII